MQNQNQGLPFCPVEIGWSQKGCVNRTAARLCDHREGQYTGAPDVYEGPYLNGKVNSSYSKLDPQICIWRDGECQRTRDWTKLHKESKLGEHRPLPKNDNGTMPDCKDIEGTVLEGLCGKFYNENTGKVCRGSLLTTNCMDTDEQVCRPDTSSVNDV